jgi:hypothetical protein
MRERETARALSRRTRRQVSSSTERAPHSRTQRHMHAKIVHHAAVARVMGGRRPAGAPLILGTMPVIRTCDWMSWGRRYIRQSIVSGAVWL